MNQIDVPRMTAEPLQPPHVDTRREQAPQEHRHGEAIAEVVQMWRIFVVVGTEAAAEPALPQHQGDHPQCQQVVLEILLLQQPHSRQNHQQVGKPLVEIVIEEKLKPERCVGGSQPLVQLPQQLVERKTARQQSREGQVAANAGGQLEEKWPQQGSPEEDNRDPDEPQAAHGEA